MLVRNRRRATHSAWPWIAALATATFLLALMAAPMSAAPSKIQLSNASVSPRTGTPKTTVVITVLYQSGKGGRAGQMNAAIDGTDHAMTRLAGGTWETGVTFRWAGKLPLGSHSVVLKAMARGSALASIGAGSVKISPPPPPPPPPAPAVHTPKPTPTPAPRTRTRPAPTPRPAVVLTVARPTPAPTTVAPDAISSQRPPDSAFPPFVLAGRDDGGPTDPTEGGPPRSGSDVPILPDGALGPGRGGAGKTNGPVAAVFAAIGFSPPLFPPLALGPTLVTTTGAVATAMAFGVFGRRRRDDELDDEDLAVAAATGMAVGPSQLVGSGMPMAGLASGVGAALGERSAADGLGAVPVTPGVDESLLPRWRRPSLLQARKTDPIRDSSPALRLTFDQGLVGPIAGHERRIIRYRVVRLLDSPDELRGVEIGYLDQGDEVQLIEKHGVYWLVLCPDGQQGWLHKMVLGEIVDGDGRAADATVATMPNAADTWTMGESDTDSDVFAAYLESRRRREA
ncbi:MAG: hypothetical protein ACJ77U_09900 [Chloroflexota bacterium]